MDDGPSETPEFYQRELQRACEECSFGITTFHLHRSNPKPEAAAAIETREGHSLEVRLSLAGYLESFCLPFGSNQERKLTSTLMLQAQGRTFETLDDLLKHLSPAFKEQHDQVLFRKLLQVSAERDTQQDTT